MQIIADRPKAPSAIPSDLGAIFISLELSRSTWLITSLSPWGGEKMSKRSVPAEQPTKPAALEIERGRGLTWRQ
jgi:transposase